MPNIANLTINDGQATPVAHTFSARSNKDGICKWADISSGSPIRYPTASILQKEPIATTKRPTYKTSVILDVPVYSATGTPAVDLRLGGLTYRLEVMSDTAATDAQRADAHAYFINFISNVDVANVFKKNTPIF